MGIKTNEPNKRNDPETSSLYRKVDGGDGSVLRSGTEIGGDLPKASPRLCASRGCSKQAVEESKYCSRKCAPFGNWKSSQDEVKDSEQKRKQLEIEYEPYGLDGILEKGKRGTGRKKMF